MFPFLAAPFREASLYLLLYRFLDLVLLLLVDRIGLAVEDGGNGVTNKFDDVTNDGRDWSYYIEQNMIFIVPIKRITRLNMACCNKLVINILKPECYKDSAVVHLNNIYGHF